MLIPNIQIGQVLIYEGGKKTDGNHAKAEIKVISSVSESAFVEVTKVIEKGPEATGIDVGERFYMPIAEMTVEWI